MNCNLVLVLVALCLGLGLSACDSDSDQGGSGQDAGQLDPTPEKLDGSQSSEFEEEDIERAEGASEAVKDYCSDAVSEAQEIGCLSHADDGDIP